MSNPSCMSSPLNVVHPEINSADTTIASLTDSWYFSANARHP